MNLKLLLFFIVSLFTLLYFVQFWENRHSKAVFHIFGQKIEMNFGLLLLAVFLDGAILAILLAWLLGYLG
jgi:hypothetical protein